MSAPKPAKTAAGKSAGKIRPLGLADSPLAQSIARKLFGSFLMLIAGLVFIQISFHFYDQSQRLNTQAKFLGHAYLPMVSNAFWSFDDAQLDAGARVLMQHEEVVGVVFRYFDAEKKPVVLKRGKTLDTHADNKLSETETAQLELLKKTGWYRFPVFYEDARQPRLLIGEMTLFINTQLVLIRHGAITLVIVLFCAAAAAVMWLIIRSVLNGSLAVPLRVLVIKLLQLQKVLPEGEVSPQDLRKLRIERFGTELRLLEKQLEKLASSALQPAMMPATPTSDTGKDAQPERADTEHTENAASSEAGDTP